MIIYREQVDALADEIAGDFADVADSNGKLDAYCAGHIPDNEVRSWNPQAYDLWMALQAYSQLCETTNPASPEGDILSCAMALRA